MKSGMIYVFSPFQVDYNPMAQLGRKPMVGLFLERVTTHSGWLHSKYRVLGPQGVEDLWSNQWSCDPVPVFVGEE